MTPTKKALIAGLVLAATTVGGTALAATSASRPEPVLEMTIRHEPPELEVGGVVAVEGVTPKPLGVEVHVLFDREGNLDEPELNVSIGRTGSPNPIIGFRQWSEEAPEGSENPWPTDGRVTAATIRTLDAACEGTGLC